MTSTAGEDIQVVFLQEATQSMAMTAQASSTPYNPQTLNLPSVGSRFKVRKDNINSLVVENPNGGFMR
jgi:hypothetical protein